MFKSPKKGQMSSPDEKSSNERRFSLSDGTSSNSESANTVKRLPPGMKKLVQHEVKLVIQHLEEQLKDFASFIEDVQRKAPSEWELVTISPLGAPPTPLPETPYSSRSSLIDQPMRDVQAVDDRPSNAPLRDAFKIVRNLLSQMSTLIHQVTLSLDAHDEEQVDPHSPFFEFYYSQYVFQITVFVMQIIGEQFNRFSETLSVVALEGNLDEIAFVDDNVQAGSRAYSVLHRKDHKFCSQPCSENRSPFEENLPYLPERTEASDRSIYPANAAHGSYDSDIRQRIADALELMMFLSQKMVACLEGADADDLQKIGRLMMSEKSESDVTPHLCPNCRMKYGSPSQIGVCDSCSIENGSNLPAEEDTLESFVNAQLDKKAFPSDIGIEKTRSSVHWTPNTIRDSGINFSINKFTSRLLEDLKTLIHQGPLESLGKSKQSDAVLNVIIRCFREASEVSVEDEKPPHPVDHIQPLKYECRDKFSREADVEDNVPSSTEQVEKPQKPQRITYTPEEEKQFDEAIDKFVVETYKVAVNSLEKKRKSRRMFPIESSEKRLAKKDEEASDDEPESEESDKKHVKKPIHCSEVPIKGCETCREGHILLSDYSGKRSKARLFIHRLSDPDKTKLVKECNEECFRGEMLHSSHDELSPGVMEVREVLRSGDLVISIKEWTEEESDVESGELVTQMVRMELPSTESKTSLPVLSQPKALLYKGFRRKPRSCTGNSHLALVQYAFKLKSVPTTIGYKGKGEKSSSRTVIAETKVTRSEVKEKDYVNLNPRTTKHRLMIDKIWKFYDDLEVKQYRKGPPLMLLLRRNHFVDDAFETLMVPSRITLQYYRNFQVFYTESEKYSRPGRKDSYEDDVEITDNFFYLLSRQLFSADNLQLFDYPSRESSYLYPNPASPSHIVMFEFAGVIMALSFLHQKPLEVELPLCFFKCLLDRPLTLYDLEEIDPILFKRLHWLKENNIDSNWKKWTFTVKEKIGSITYFPELIPRGREKYVNEENKFEYITKCVKWKLAERCLMQMKALRRGFVAVMDPKMLDRFDAEDLQHLIEKEADDLSSSDEEDDINDPIAIATPRRETI